MCLVDRGSLRRASNPPQPNPVFRILVIFFYDYSGLRLWCGFRHYTEPLFLSRMPSPPLLDATRGPQRDRSVGAYFYFSPIFAASPLSRAYPFVIHEPPEPTRGFSGSGATT